MDITGLITLPRSLLFQKEVLGKVYGAVISGIKVDIYFPDYPVEYIENEGKPCGIFYPLKPPSIAKKWKRGEEKLYWGFPRDYPHGNSQINLLAFKINAEENSLQSVSKEQYNAIVKWAERFVQYCLVCTRQSAYRNNNKNEGAAWVEFVDSKEYTQSDITASLTGIVYSAHNYASSQQAQSAIKYASSGKELLLEYQMLLSAYNAKNNTKNRQVILDACTALELCLINEIRRFCVSKGLEEDILLDKYRYLGDKFDLVSKINPHAVNGISKKAIIPLRNSIMHTKIINPSNEETDTLLKEVEKTLSNCYTDYY